MARKPVTPAAAEPRLRRGYFESRFGQLHVHNAIPPGGGFDEATPLICLHGLPGTGAEFVPLLAAMGRDRSVYAPDLPGSGNSDGPPAEPSITDLAGAVQDFCVEMHFRQLDLLGHAQGARVAVELAQAVPQMVRRVVLVGAPAAATDAERLARQRLPAARTRQLPAPTGPQPFAAAAGGLAAQLREFLRG